MQKVITRILLSTNVNKELFVGLRWPSGLTRQLDRGRVEGSKPSLSLSFWDVIYDPFPGSYTTYLHYTTNQTA